MDERKKALEIAREWERLRARVVCGATILAKPALPMRSAAEIELRDFISLNEDDILRCLKSFAGGAHA